MLLFDFYTIALFETPLSHCLLPLITLSRFHPAFPLLLHAHLIFRLPLPMRQQQTQTRRDKVGCDPEGMTEKEVGESGGGWARGKFRERMMVLCLCVCLCQKPGGLSDIILPRTIQILPPKTFPSCFAFSLVESHAWAHRNTHIAKNN